MELAGRATELEQLTAFASGDGPAVLALVEGEAGIGKTALWSAVVERARAGGSTVLVARPSLAERASAHAALADLLAPARPLLPDLPEAQRRALAVVLGEEDGPVPDSALVALAVRTLVAATAARAPLLLAVDDWQWLDEPSALALRPLVRRLAGTHARLVATVRTGEDDAGVAALTRSLADGEVLELALPPLDRQAIARLVERHTGRRPAPPVVSRLLERSRGNPLVAVELLRGEGDGPRAATDARQVLGARLAALDAPAWEVMRAAAALGRPDTASIEAALDGRAAPGLDAALAAGVLEREGERLRFAHPLMIDVVLERTAPSALRALHRRLADVVDDPQARARHVALGTEAPDESVAGLLEAAAERARAHGDLAVAADLAQRAADLTPAADDAARLRRLLALAAVHAQSADGDRAREILEPLAARLPAGPARARVLCRLAWLGMEGREEEVLRRALVEAAGDDAILAEAHQTLADVAFVRDGNMIPDAELALVHARRCGNARLAAGAIASIAVTAFVRGDGVQWERLREAERLEAGARLALEHTAASLLGYQRFIAGDLAGGRELLEREAARAAEAGATAVEGQAVLWLAEIELRAGRLARADAHVRRGLDLALGAATNNAELSILSIRALVDAHLDRAEAMRAAAERSLALAEEFGDRVFAVHAAHALGLYALAHGDGVAARRHLEDLPAAEAALGFREPMIYGLGPDLAEALVLGGGLDRAEAVVRELREAGERLGREWALGTADRAAALVASARGDHDGALALAGRAAERLAAAGFPFEHARAVLVLGAAQRRAKQRGAARATLGEAHALFAGMGAAGWAARAEAELGRLGGRRTRDDRDALTATEDRIAALAAAGRSNREIAGELFVSERTVEANLTRVFRKVGVRSRTELARRYDGAAKHVDSPLSPSGPGT